MAYERDLGIRFWSKVNIGNSDDCWEWQAGKRSGYGSFCIYYKPCYAHRVSWELTYGPIPEGKLCLHKCDNRICVNPSHLYLGTHADNVLDREYRCKNYLRGRISTITKNNIIEMKNLYSLGTSYSKIAKKFNISRRYSSMLINNERGSNAI